MTDRQLALVKHTPEIEYLSIMNFLARCAYDKITISMIPDCKEVEYLKDCYDQGSLRYLLVIRND